MRSRKRTVVGIFPSHSSSSELLLVCCPLRRASRCKSAFRFTAAFLSWRRCSIRRYLSTASSNGDCRYRRTSSDAGPSPELRLLVASASSSPALNDPSRARSLEADCVLSFLGSPSWLRDLPLVVQRDGGSLGTWALALSRRNFAVWRGISANWARSAFSSFRSASAAAIRLRKARIFAEVFACRLSSVGSVSWTALLGGSGLRGCPTSRVLGLRDAIRRRSLLTGDLRFERHRCASLDTQVQTRFLR